MDSHCGSDLRHHPSQIETHLDHTRFDYEIFVSQYAGHAAILAKDAVNQHVDILAVAGGDGSINEVGTPLIGTDLALAVIPCGSGNGLSRCLDLPLDPVKALQVINGGHKRKIDTVDINGTPFISISGTGYDAKVAEDYSKDPRRGFDTYFKYILRNYITMKEQPYTIVMPDQTLDVQAFFISFANSNQMGYDFPISPHASLWDTICMTDFEMQMGSTRTTRVARISNQIALLDREFVLVGKDLRSKGLVLILVLLDILGDLTRETLQVGIHRGIAIIMRDIQHVTITIGRHPDAAHVTVGHGIDLLSLYRLCLDVETRMEMVGAQLTKGGGEIDGDVDGFAILGEVLLCHKAHTSEK